MNETPDLPEQQEPAPNETDTDDQPDVDEQDENGSGISLGLSRKQGMVLALIAVVALYYLIKVRGDNSGGQRPQKLDDARSEDMTADVEVEDEDEDETVEIPQDPASPLEADAAVTQMMKDSGRIGAGD